MGHQAIPEPAVAVAAPEREDVLLAGLGKVAEEPVVGEVRSKGIGLKGRLLAFEAGEIVGVKARQSCPIGLPLPV